MSSSVALFLSGATIALISSSLSTKDKKKKTDTLHRNVCTGVCSAVLLAGIGSDGGWPEVLTALLRKTAVAGSGVVLGHVLRSAMTANWSGSEKKKDCKFQSVAPFSSPAECVAVIEGAKRPDADVPNTFNRFEARAIPNQRLVKAFNIHNCFTTSQKTSCEFFRSTVEKKLYVAEAKWQDFARAAKIAAAREFAGKEASTPTSLNLFAVVQMVTMKLVPKVFFDFEEESPDTSRRDETMRALAEEINEQWLRSKEKKNDTCTSSDDNDPPDWIFSKQTALRDAVHTTFPAWSGDRETNPLNMILPGYETVWRVVLRCFIEVTSRKHEDATIWTKTLLDFLANPTRAELERESGKEANAMMIAKEALRLYPPTRRIYRQFKDDKGQESQVAADVESMHRRTDVWGEDAAKFRPERWRAVTQSFEDRNWLPFGAKPFRCPAKRHTKPVEMPFGVALVALLTAALLSETEGRWVCGHGLPQDGSPLETDRHAYKDMVLCRKDSA